MTAPTPADLVDRFTQHAPGLRQVAAHRHVREQALAYAALLVDLVPAGREQALALTNLEQVVFWANAGIARAPQ